VLFCENKLIICENEKSADTIKIFRAGLLNVFLKYDKIIPLKNNSSPKTQEISCIISNGVGVYLLFNEISILKNITKITKRFKINIRQSFKLPTFSPYSLNWCVNFNTVKTVPQNKIKITVFIISFAPQN